MNQDYGRNDREERILKMFEETELTGPSDEWLELVRIKEESSTTLRFLARVD